MRTAGPHAFSANEGRRELTLLLSLLRRRDKALQPMETPPFPPSRISPTPTAPERFLRGKKGSLLGEIGPLKKPIHPRKMGVMA